jgi:hypothetical protein
MAKYIAFVFILVALITLTFARAEEPTFSGLLNVVKDKMGNSDVLTSDPDVYDEIDTYITMFLRGAKVIPSIENSTQCVDATRDFARSIDAPFKNLIDNKFSVDNYLKVTAAVGGAQDTIETCFEPGYGGFTKLSTHLSQFSSAGSFFEKMGLRVLYGFFDWYDLYYNFDAAIDKKNTTMIVYFSGQLTHSLLDFDSSLNGTLSSKQTGLTLEVGSSGVVGFVYDLFRNFFMGAQITSNKDVDKCVDTTLGFYQTFESAMNDFKNHTAEGDKSGVYQIASLFSAFHDINSQCWTGYNTSKNRVLEYWNIKATPIEIIFNLVWNVRKIFKHVVSSVECIFSLDGECIGLNTGGIIYQIFAKHK